MQLLLRNWVALALGVLLLQGVGLGREEEPEGPCAISGGVSQYTAQAGDSLSSIGAQFGVDAATLAFDNGIAANARLAVDHALVIDNRHIVPRPLETELLVINLPQRMLFYRTADGILFAHPVAIGRSSWRTPTGDFTILVKEEHPTWNVPVSILEESRSQGRELPPSIPPGPNNPLGKFWLGLSLPGIGIHGTNAPSSIFRAVSHGCIRMHPDAIAGLFPHVQVGTAGRTIYEPVLVAEAGGDVYLEVHRDIYRRLADDPHRVARALAEAAELSARIDWNAADAVVAARHGIARRVTARHDGGQP